MVSGAWMLPDRARVVQAAAVALAVTLLLVAFLRHDAGAVAPEDGPFAGTWARTDKPVADLQVSRTWMWGPEANTDGMFEPYVEGHNNGRFVQYFDKARMEITTEANIPIESPWYVTNGLLVNELMLGQIQVGNNTFTPSMPADINVAGDLDSATGPTYADLAELRDAAPHAIGSVIDATVDHNGVISTDAAFATYGVTAAEHVELTNHTVASVFWEFMNSEGLVWENEQFVIDDLFQNPFYATGYPVTEAYWTTVELDDVPTDVLLQCFERRCLTYTPDNPAGWLVEAGNVGLHYYVWRYGEDEATPTPTATATATATSTATATATETLPPGVTTTGNMQIEFISADSGVIIRNMQVAGDIQMEGWQLRDDAGQTFTFPAVVVREGFYVSVRNCDGEDIIENKYAILYWGACVPFPQGKVYLIDSTGELTDTYPN